MADVVKDIVRVLGSGSSFSALAATASGRHLVLKLSGAGHGAAGLAHELIATRLAGALGLRVPAAAPVRVAADHPWQAGTDEFDEAVQRSAGWNLGLAFVPDAIDVAASDLATLPADFTGRLAAVDALLQNVDRTAANPNLLRDRAGAFWAIDFGACLFLHRLRSQPGVPPRLVLPPNHFLAGRTLAPLRLEAAAAEVAGIVADVPDDWVVELATSRAVVTDELAAFLVAAREILQPS